MDAIRIHPWVNIDEVDPPERMLPHGDQTDPNFVGSKITAITADEHLTTYTFRQHIQSGIGLKVIPPGFDRRSSFLGGSSFLGNSREGSRRSSIESVYRAARRPSCSGDSPHADLKRTTSTRGKGSIGTDDAAAHNRRASAPPSQAVIQPVIVLPGFSQDVLESPSDSGSSSSTSFSLPTSLPPLPGQDRKPGARPKSFAAPCRDSESMGRRSSVASTGPVPQSMSSAGVGFNTTPLPGEPEASRNTALLVRMSTAGPGIAPLLIEDVELRRSSVSSITGFIKRASPFRTSTTTSPTGIRNSVSSEPYIPLVQTPMISNTIIDTALDSSANFTGPRAHAWRNRKESSDDGSSNAGSYNSGDFSYDVFATVSRPENKHQSHRQPSNTTSASSEQVPVLRKGPISLTIEPPMATSDALIQDTTNRSPSTESGASASSSPQRSSGQTSSGASMSVMQKAPSFASSIGSYLSEFGKGLAKSTSAERPQQQSVEPSDKEIEEWHMLHAIPKQIRVARFFMGSSTTSSLPAAAVFLDVHRVLVAIQNLNGGILKFKREKSLYLFRCELLPSTETASSVVFDVEVCSVWLLKLYGVRIKRISGNAIKFKEM
ncbi:hypothetical protein SmJEL517_g03807 [Synchytrium microbalum]|uniref:non-specific serine/threonine protein kinase n=1 Tax=Synchytrium microbalum TaxID=1806994 RepID=A0A507C6X3_9FUNG|nr:uncharacterized protein SmJEL517_g03807 [Synchytrium microbalum]TPX33225.1 hypothetical protein SmJEL517_g03807 [Synchytrium microbalum]